MPNGVEAARQQTCPRPRSHYAGPATVAARFFDPRRCRQRQHWRQNERKSGDVANDPSARSRLAPYREGFSFCSPPVFLAHSGVRVREPPVSARRRRREVFKNTSIARSCAQRPWVKQQPSHEAVGEERPEVSGHPEIKTREHAKRR